MQSQHHPAPGTAKILPSSSAQPSSGTPAPGPFVAEPMAAMHAARAPLQRRLTALVGGLLAAGLLAGPVLAADPPPKSGLAAVLDAAPAADWRKPDPDNVLYMELPTGRVVIELAPFFAPNHVVNIRKLVREGYFDGLSILRSQENYVVQWGDPEEKNPRPIKTAQQNLKGEFSVPVKKNFPFTRLPDLDTYAPQTGFVQGFPAGYDPKSGQAWMTHCPGIVGVGRDNSSDSGDGSALYTVIGHAPRHLDRNITLVGRVIDGMPLLSTVKRGNGTLGFFTAPEDYVPIRQIRLASDVPEKERVNLELLKTDSPSFKLAVAALRNRKNDWFKVQAGHVEVCNIPVMARPAK